eukprot:CAMPEP_0194751270 /NCGR_PEP_ID=MMETSP0323_2-20130528/5383_1 /TAXON_ID=2866 ORGANISM="Crypthecodinium cohnii, Strain Seligo" /NCGR_SAMPLE_ID=MMETSP0323_2 /ASSEMBLY_ACC=CAM_ASM_000346 /LENGTH=56 /DNA_ID=CAMNT_0039667715 /DNA_START=422 /DNA_END=592 /DNA_ORIENTATION=-
MGPGWAGPYMGAGPRNFGAATGEEDEASYTKSEANNIDDRKLAVPLHSTSNRALPG